MKKKIFSIITLLIMCVLWVNAQVYHTTNPIDPDNDVAFTYSIESGSVTIKAVVVGINVTSVTVPSSMGGVTVKVIGNSEVDNTPVGAFENCSTITSIELPSTITEIRACAFKGCTALVNVKFTSAPTGLKLIDNEAFYHCSALENFGTGDNYTSLSSTQALALGTAAFEGCSSISSLMFLGSGGTTSPKESSTSAASATSSSNLTTNRIFYGCTSLTSTDFLSDYKYKTLPKACFANCTSLIEINCSTAVTTIGNQAFMNCTSLEQVKFVKKGTSSASAVLKVEAYAFSNCSSLKSFEFKSSTSTTSALNNTSIESNAFSSCENLLNIDLGHMKDIKSYAFMGATNLKTIDIRLASNLGEYAFQDCESLEKVTLSIKYGTIPEGMFEGCSNLSEITIPSNVKTIGNAAFSSCAALSSVIIPKEVEDIGPSAFNSTSEIFLQHDDPSSLILGNYSEDEDEEGNKVKTYLTPFKQGSDGSGDAIIYIPLGSYDKYFDPTGEIYGEGDLVMPVQLACIRGLDEGFVDEEDAIWHEVTHNPTWEYKAKATVGEIEGYDSEDEDVEYVPVDNDGVLDLCDYIPTRIDDLTILMGRETKDYIIYGDADRTEYDGENLPFRVWNKFTIKRTIPKDKYYYMSLPFDIEEGTWGDNFKVYPSDDPESDLTENYLEEEPKGGFSEDEHNSFYIYKFSSKLFSQGYYNDTAFKYVKPGSEFLTGNSYAFGVDDDDDYESLTFEFSKDVEGDHIDPFDDLSINVEAIANSDPIEHSYYTETNLNNWIMLANPFLAAIDISSTNYDEIFSGIRYAYAFEVNNDTYDPDSPEPEDKAYKLEPKDFEYGNEVNAYPHNPIYVQVADNTNKIEMGYVKSVETQGAQQIPAAAPRHSRIIDLALIADGEQLDHTEIKDNPTGADEYVIGEDFYKMFNSGFDEIYTMIGDSVECFANELNLQTSNRVVPLAFHIYNAGDFTLSLKNKANILDYKVYLRNLTDNSVTDLLVNDPTLHLGEGISEGDYQIEIDYAPTAVSAVENDGNSKVYVLADGLLHIDNLGSSVVSLYDATGKLLSVTDPHSDNLELTLPARGIYFVNLRGSENSTVKVVY